MDALVLSGGNIRGAWQAGAIRSVLEAGFKPGIITGTSAGALNAAHLAAFQPRTGKAWTWEDAGRTMTEFWAANVTGPDSVMRKRGFLELAYRIARKRWRGAVSMDPMEATVRKALAGMNMAGPAIVEVTSVDLGSGELVYTGSDSPDFLDAVIASTAEPVSMNHRLVQGRPHCDGGLVEITPLRRAIMLGATRVVTIVCQGTEAPGANVTGDLLKLVGRVVQLATYEILRNDLEHMAAVNREIRAATIGAARGTALKGKRDIPLTVIHPSKGANFNMESFTGADIKAMIAQGMADGAAAMARSPE